MWLCPRWSVLTGVSACCSPRSPTVQFLAAVASMPVPIESRFKLCFLSSQPFRRESYCVVFTVIKSSRVPRLTVSRTRLVAVHTVSRRFLLCVHFSYLPLGNGESVEGQEGTRIPIALSFTLTELARKPRGCEVKSVRSKIGRNAEV